MRHLVTKVPLTKVGQTCTNFANMFPCLFELQLLDHFEMLHPQYQNNFHTHDAGRAEDVPRGLVGRWEIFIEQIAQVRIIFEKPCRVSVKRV